MRPLRTRFKRQIIAEFLPPRKASDWKKGRVVILCAGLPSSPSKTHALEYFSKKGYWAFSPRYRGTWESEGKLFRFSPAQDVRDVLDALPLGFKELVSRKIFKVRTKKVVLVASSFGGPAVLLNSKDKRVHKVITFSPVSDWRVHFTKGETIDDELMFIREAFGDAYRFALKDWKKLKTGTFYNPATMLKKIDGTKVLIFQAKDDTSVPWQSVSKLAHDTQARLVLVPRGGHFGFGELVKPKFHKAIARFLKA